MSYQSMKPFGWIGVADNMSHRIKWLPRFITTPICERYDWVVTGGEIGKRWGFF